MQRTPRKHNSLLHLVLASALVFLWIFLTPSAEQNYDAFPNTLRSLKTMKDVIEAYKQEFGHVPRDLGEMRAYATYKFADDIAPYDGYATRISYIPLTDRFYILKSFGSDLAENQVGGAEDISASHLPTMPELTPRVDVSNEQVIGPYPSALILGSKAPNGHLRARVVSNRLTSKRYLLVQNPKQPNFEMVAPMAKVEEFLWLPSGYELVFTVCNDDVYRDGVYLWNLMTNDIHNVLADVKADTPPLAAMNDDQIFVTLSTVNFPGQKVYFFLSPVRKGPVGFFDLYSPDNLYQLDLAGKHYKQMRVEKAPTGLSAMVRGMELTHQANMLKPYSGNTVQRVWQALPHRGSIDKLIGDWQELSVNLSETPLFPYSLWWLASLYGQAAAQIEGQSAKDAASLRAYGIELARALSQMEASPMYLRALGEEMARKLSLSEPLDYQVAQFSL